MLCLVLSEQISCKIQPFFQLSDSKSSKFQCFGKNSRALGKKLKHFEKKLKLYWQSCIRAQSVGLAFQGFPGKVPNIGGSTKRPLLFSGPISHSLSDFVSDHLVIPNRIYKRASLQRNRNILDRPECNFAIVFKLLKDRARWLRCHNTHNTINKTKGAKIMTCMIWNKLAFNLLWQRPSLGYAIWGALFINSYIIIHT